MSLNIDVNNMTEKDEEKILDLVKLTRDISFFDKIMIATKWDLPIEYNAGSPDDNTKEN